MSDTTSTPAGSTADTQALAQSMQALARQGLAGKAIAAAVLTATDAARDELLQLMMATGAEKVAVSDEAKTRLGTMSCSPGKRTAEVHDESAFTAWVAKEYPTEIVQAVRQAWVKKILADVMTAGEPVDVRTGQVIPGVRLVEGEPYLVTRPNPQARARAQELVEGGGISAITAGPHREVDTSHA